MTAFNSIGLAQDHLDYNTARSMFVCCVVCVDVNVGERDSPSLLLPPPPPPPPHLLIGIGTGEGGMGVMCPSTFVVPHPLLQSSCEFIIAL